MEEKEDASPAKLINEDLTQPYLDQAESDLLPSLPTNCLGTQLSPPGSKTQQDSAEDGSQEAVSVALVCTDSTGPVANPGSIEGIGTREVEGQSEGIADGSSSQAIARLQQELAKSCKPWLADFNFIHSGYMYKSTGARVALYDCSSLSRRYYHALDASKLDPTKRVSSEPLYISWNHYGESNLLNKLKKK
ncbi:hypothetical protein DVH05_019348 [Phytophthora capsici]|nr:hypothetical protein DVH05_019348 [Phytophthora capsici]